MRLVELRPGQKARVAAIEGPADLRGRLAGMGLAVGSEIMGMVCRRGTPLVVAAGRTRLAIDQEVAREVILDVEEQASGSGAA